MGSGNGKIKREIEDLKRDRERRQAEHQKMTDQLNKQLSAAREERKRAGEQIKDLTATLDRERRESQQQVNDLKASQERLMAKVQELIQAFKSQEASYQSQLAEARADNAKLTRRIDELLAQLASQREEHKKEMADFRARSEDLVQKLMEESAKQTEANRELLDKIKGMMDKNNGAVPAAGRISDVVTLSENHKEANELERQICRAEKLLEQTVNFEIQSVAELVKDKPIAGSILAALARQEREKRAVWAAARPNCGADGWMRWPEAIAPPSLPLIA